VGSEVDWAVIEVWLCIDCAHVQRNLETCESCGGVGTLRNPTGVDQIILQYQAIRRRVEQVVKIIDAGAEKINFTIQDFPDSSTVEVEWTTYCGRGCCGPDSHEREFPMRYLFQTDEVIKAAEAKLADERKKVVEEAERREKIAKAEVKLLAARTKINTAQAKAEQEAADLERELAALREGSS